MALNLHLLRLFAIVAEQGSFSRAAQAAHISQPAVTKSLQELEKQVGLPLLERGARGVRLTEAGVALQEHARAIFAVEQLAEDDLRAHRGLSGGTLRIGATLTIGPYFLPPYVARFHELYPLLDLHLTTNNTEAITRLLLDYKLDVALVEGPVEHERVQVRKWRDDKLAIVAAHNHPLTRREGLKVVDLKDTDWVVREPGSGTREVVDDALRELGLQCRRKLEVDSTEAVKQTVAAGFGLAFVSLHSADDQIKMRKLRVLQVSNVTVTRPLNFLNLKNRPLSLAARAFEAFLEVPLDSESSRYC